MSYRERKIVIGMSFSRIGITISIASYDFNI